MRKNKMKKPEIAYLAPDIILRMIINNDKDVDKLLKQKKIKIVTSAFSFWEAISCLQEKEIKKNAKRIYELLHSIPITDMAPTYPGYIHKDYKTPEAQRITHLRKIAEMEWRK